MTTTTPFPRRCLPALLLAAACSGSPSDAGPPEAEAPPADQVAVVDSAGRLARPEGYEGWVMVGASTGLSYNTPGAAPAAGAAPGMFHNVYLQPWAYRKAMEDGAFPEGAMLVLTFWEPSRKSDPARAGFYEGDRIPGMEVHLKRAGADSTGWGFYGFGDTTTFADRIPSTASCYQCHSREAAFDQAFVQFYPALRERLLGRADSLATSTAPGGG